MPRIIVPTSLDVAEPQRHPLAGEDIHTLLIAGKVPGAGQPAD